MILQPRRSTRSTCPRAPIFAAVLLLALTGGGRAHAVTIEIDLGNPGTFSSFKLVTFDDLNGTSLQGQSLPLDFIFANEESVRLFTDTFNSFDAQITFETDHTGTFLPFILGTGYLLDAHGDALHTPRPLVHFSGLSVTGAAFFGNILDPFILDLNGTPAHDLHAPFDFYGVHYDLMFPLDPSVKLTGGDFQLTSRTVPFGISVPDTGSTWLLLGIGVIGMMGVSIAIARGS